MIAPLLVWRRGEDDFLLLTEPELGETVRAHLTRMRIAAKCEIESEEHTSAIVLGGTEGIPNDDYGVPAVEVLDGVDPGRAGRRGARAPPHPRAHAALGHRDRRRDPARRGRPRRPRGLLHQGLLPGPGAARAAAAPRPRQPQPARARARRRAGAPGGRDRPRRPRRRPGHELGARARARLRQGRGTRRRRRRGRRPLSARSLTAVALLRRGIASISGLTRRCKGRSARGCASSAA